MALNLNTTSNYKSCPLKKRPVVFENDSEKVEIANVIMHFNKQEIVHNYSNNNNNNKNSSSIQEQPQDLSLKRKASFDDEIQCSAPSSKRDCVLDLSKSSDDSHHVKYRPDTPISIASELSNSGSHLMVKSEVSSHHAMINEYDVQQNIHLRGLNAATSSYTTIPNPYKAAFVLAAGTNPLNALWHQPQQQYVPINAVFPSPASSIASPVSNPASSPVANTSNSSSYHHITPPCSPNSELPTSEPEDLSMRSDIPLPALFHFYDEAMSSRNSTPSKSSMSPSSMNASSTTSAASLYSTSTSSSSKPYRFKCEKCNKMYSTLIGLNKHQQFHCPAAECNQEKKQHSCEECGKLYTTIGALKMHIRTHTLPCKCHICGKAFSRPWLLQGHIRTHTGEKPFNCPDCPRSFADRSNLRAHQQTHVDVKKYVCKVCNKSFSRMSLLNKHINSNCTITIA